MRNADLHTDNRILRMRARGTRPWLTAWRTKVMQYEAERIRKESVLSFFTMILSSVVYFAGGYNRSKLK